MNMFRFSRISKVVMVAVLIATGYIGVQAMRDKLWADSEFEPNKITGLDTIDQALKSERLEQRFIGDIDGIFIAPEGTPVPEQYIVYEDLCNTPYSRNVTWEEAGELNLMLNLPEKYVLQVDDMNTGAVACGDTVYVARRTYTVNGGQVIIGRSRFTSVEEDVAVDRPKIKWVNGRDVVLIESLTKSGTFQNAYAYFPETFGDTFIHATGVSKSDFTALVELVASSTK